MSRNWQVLLGVCFCLCLLSGAVFQFLLREEERAEPPPAEIPRLPDPDPKSVSPTPAESPRTPTIQSVRRAAIDVEVAQLENVIAAQEQLLRVQEGQREYLVESIKRYRDLAANGDAGAAPQLMFFRRKQAELAMRRPEIEAAIAENESLRPVLRDKLKLAEEQLLALKQASAGEEAILERTKAVGATKQQISTLDCRIASSRDQLAWVTVQHEALSMVLTGTGDAVTSAVGLLAQWKPPRLGIAALTSQLNALKAERESLGK
ncbi:MAG: hypothetical protein U0792_00270 [Gemmataceae bacterium]